MTRNQMQDAYFSTKVLNSKQYDSMIKLLSIFAEHISMISNQIVFQQHHSEPPVITRAKEFIVQNHEEDISLGKSQRRSTPAPFTFAKCSKRPQVSISPNTFRECEWKKPRTSS